MWFGYGMFSLRAAHTHTYDVHVQTTFTISNIVGNRNQEASEQNKIHKINQISNCSDQKPACT